MVTAEDIKYELSDNTIENVIIEKQITRSKNFIKGYCNNLTMFDEENDLLDEVIIYLVVSKLNKDTKGKQGLNNESVGGVSFGFAVDIPSHLKMNLNKFRRARLI
jgi:hypothetical protein